ncbi:transposase [Streptomyces sp. NPDC046985]|uniref:transposase n=1 Tax=Streptomyces sp. NPDC046985 TaxID=3155377 RepID=UPI0033DDEB16
MMKCELARRLVPDGMWNVVEPLLPAFTGRRQGGGTAPLDERRTFTAVVYVLTSGCSWRQLPPWCAVSSATAHRRFLAWTQSSLWGRLAEAAATHPDEPWIHDVVAAAHVRAASIPGRS